MWRFKMCYSTQSVALIGFDMAKWNHIHLLSGKHALSEIQKSLLLVFYTEFQKKKKENHTYLCFVLESYKDYAVVQAVWDI